MLASLGLACSLPPSARGAAGLRQSCRAALVLTSLLFAGSARADNIDRAALAWQPHPGTTTPLSSTFTDETGRRVALRDYTGAPIILSLGYYRCPTLCGTVRADLVAAMAGSGLDGGHDYQLVAVSIDPAETPQVAAAAKAADLAQVPGSTGLGWHYLTGDATALARATGFPFQYDTQLQQFAHPAGVVVLTANGLVSSYIEGVGYTGAVLREAVQRAATGTIAATPSPVLLLCFHFDASTGRYTLAIEKVLRLMAGATVLAVVALLAVLHRRRAQRVT